MGKLPQSVVQVRSNGTGNPLFLRWAHPLPGGSGPDGSVQTFHHDTAFDIAAARPALTAGKGKLVFGADWLDLIHDFFVHFVPP